MTKIIEPIDCAATKGARREAFDAHKSMMGSSVHRYVAGYEFRGDGGDYTPSESERAMIEDAIEGYLATNDALTKELGQFSNGGPV